MKIPISITGNISIYIHIPFCLSKCPYCPFYSVVYTENAKNAFLGGLHSEWNRYSDIIQEKTIISLYFGGGTPSLLSPYELEQIINIIQPPTTTEITLEANPDDLDKDYVQALLSIGINRLSVGIQTLNDLELKILKRRYSAKEAINAIDLCYSSGIHNISTDLIYGLPTQTPFSWEQTLKQIFQMPLTHLSLYDLSLEPNTPFYHRKNLPLPNETTILSMHKTALRQLQQMGFCRYEISSFARNNHISLHNVGYWTGREYIGLGPSASSYIDGKRKKNFSNLMQYVQKASDQTCYEEERLPYPSALQERIAIGLRLVEGIDLSPFLPLPNGIEATLQKLQEQKLLHQKNNCWKLTKKGLLFYDEVAIAII